MPEAVAITLESGQRLGEWSDIELQFGLDSYSACSLGGPFDHTRTDVRKALQPLLFPRVEVTINDELVLTGRVKDVAPTVDAGAASVGVTVYSMPYDLTEVCPAPELLPLEFNGFDLKKIADRLVGPSVGVRAVFSGPLGATFSRVRCEPDSVIHSFLVELALQRGFVLSDLPNGDLLFQAETPAGSPVARLKGQPVGKVSVQFEPGSWYSSITGRAGKKSGRTGSRFTVPNSLYRASHPRSFSISVGDTESADVPQATRAAIGRMAGSVASYTVEDLPTWRDSSGALWTPNTTVTLEAPEAMVYRETELLIRSVKLHQTAEIETATLGLVLPGSFGGVSPTTELPWDF